MGTQMMSCSFVEPSEDLVLPLNPLKSRIQTHVAQSFGSFTLIARTKDTPVMRTRTLKNAHRSK